MDIFIKTVSGVLICLVLYLVLDKQGKDMSFMLSLFGCAAVLITSLTFIKPIISFFDEVKILGKLDSDILSVILKTVGIGMLGEISATICTDAGNAALGKAVQMMANAMMLWLSIPLFRNLLEMVQDMLVRI